MSAQATGRVWQLDLPHAEKYVLLALADHADHLGDNIYPSIGLVAWKAGYSGRQVQRIIGRLIERSILIPVEARAGRPLVYRMDLEAGPVKAPYERHNDGGDKMSGVTRRPTPPRQNVASPHDKMSHPPRQNVTPTPDIPTATPDIALSGGGDIAMSPKPSVNQDLKNHHQNAPALRLIPGSSGGGVEIDERYDDGDQDDDRTLDPDVMVETCEIESEQTRRAELVDSLVALGIWRPQAFEAVLKRTVTTEHDIVCCKRFIAASTADNPASVLWTRWLSTGDVPPLPRETPSSVTSSQIEAARMMREESDRLQQPPAEVIGARAMAEALRAGTIRAMPPAARKVLTPAASFWR